MARLPGQIQDPGIAPSQIAVVSPVRAAIGGVTQAANALQNFGELQNQDRVQRERNLADTQLDQLLLDFDTAITSNPGVEDGIVEEFDAMVGDVIDDLGEGINSEQQRAVFRARSLRAVGLGRAKAQQTQATRQITASTTALNTSIDTTLSRALQLGQPKDQVVLEISQKLNDAVGAGLFTRAHADAAFRQKLSAFDVATVNQLGELEQYGAINQGLKSGQFQHLSPQQTVVAKNLARNGIQSLAFTEVSRLLDADEQGDRFIADLMIEDGDFKAGDRQTLRAASNASSRRQITSEYNTLLQNDEPDLALEFLNKHRAQLGEATYESLNGKAQGVIYKREQDIGYRNVVFQISRNDIPEAAQVLADLDGFLDDPRRIALEGALHEASQANDDKEARRISQELTERLRSIQELERSTKAGRTSLQAENRDRMLLQMEQLKQTSEAIGSGLGPMDQFELAYGDETLGALVEAGFLSTAGQLQITNKRGALLKEENKRASLERRFDAIQGGSPAAASNPDDQAAIDAGYARLLADQTLTDAQKYQGIAGILEHGVVPTQMRDEMVAVAESGSVEDVGRLLGPFQLMQAGLQTDILAQLPERTGEFWSRLSARSLTPSFAGGPQATIDELRQSLRPQPSGQGVTTPAETQRASMRGRHQGVPTGETDSQGNPKFQGGMTPKRVHAGMRNVIASEKIGLTNATHSDDLLDFFDEELIQPTDARTSSETNFLTRYREVFKAEFLRLNPDAPEEETERLAHERSIEILLGGGDGTGTPEFGIETALTGGVPTLTKYPTSLQGPAIVAGAGSVESDVYIPELVELKLLAPLDALGKRAMELGVGPPSDPTFAERYEGALRQMIKEGDNVLAANVNAFAWAMSYLGDPDVQAWVVDFYALGGVFTGDTASRRERATERLRAISPVRLMIAAHDRAFIGKGSDGRPLVQYTVMMDTANGPVALPQEITNADGTKSIGDFPGTILFDREEAPSVKELRKEGPRNLALTRARDAGVLDFGQTMGQRMAADPDFARALDRDAPLRRKFFIQAGQEEALNAPALNLQGLQPASPTQLEVEYELWRDGGLERFGPAPVRTRTGLEDAIEFFSGDTP